MACSNVEHPDLVDNYLLKHPVRLHADPNGMGRTAELDYGDYPILPCMDEDDLTSIVIRDRYTEVDLYQKNNYQGKKLTLKGPLNIAHMDEQDLTEDWEDDTGSLKIRRLPMDIKQKYLCCNAGAGAGECSDYYGNKAKCDDFMIREYCPNNPRDPVCSCINFYTRNPSLGVNPKCVDSTCATRGYITQNIENNRCPTIINCTMQNQMANSGIKITPIIKLEQNCGEKSNSILNSNVPSSGVLDLIKSNWIWITLGFFVLIILMILIGIAVSYSNKKKEEEYSQYYQQ
jgi:hypothetical protein